MICVCVYVCVEVQFVVHGDAKGLELWQTCNSLPTMSMLLAKAADLNYYSCCIQIPLEERRRFLLLYSCKQK